jgi:hypothetical protein
MHAGMRPRPPSKMRRAHQQLYIFSQWRQCTGRPWTVDRRPWRGEVSKAIAPLRPAQPRQGSGRTATSVRTTALALAEWAKRPLCPGARCRRGWRRQAPLRAPVGALRFGAGGGGGGWWGPVRCGLGPPPCASRRTCSTAGGHEGAARAGGGARGRWPGCSSVRCGGIGTHTHTPHTPTHPLPLPIPDSGPSPLPWAQSGRSAMALLI